MKKKSKTIKKPSRWQVFCAGVFVGIVLFWLPSGTEFHEVIASKAILEKSATSAFPMPQTAPQINREGYSLAYDGRTRNPYWVYHKITPETLEKNADRSHFDFQEDALIPKHIRATKEDFFRSGFDRGHLCPAADSSSSAKTLEESFLLTNISPQNPTFNRGYWKQVEQHMRDLAKTHKQVHVFTGPLFLKTKGQSYVRYELIGKNEIAVPTHFFACAFIEMPSKKQYVSAYIIPNAPIDKKVPLKKFSCTLEELEKASGIIFASG